jgi:hypothetical protein
LGLLKPIPNLMGKSYFKSSFVHSFTNLPDTSKGSETTVTGFGVVAGGKGKETSKGISNFLISPFFN